MFAYTQAINKKVNIYMLTMYLVLFQSKQFIKEKKISNMKDKEALKRLSFYTFTYLYSTKALILI